MKKSQMYTNPIHKNCFSSGLNTKPNEQQILFLPFFFPLKQNTNQLTLRFLHNKRVFRRPFYIVHLPANNGPNCSRHQGNQVSASKQFCKRLWLQEYFQNPGKKRYISRIVSFSISTIATGQFKISSTNKCKQNTSVFSIIISVNNVL